MRFLWTTIMVKNMEESLKFYQEILKLTVNKKFESDHGEIVFLGDGETQVELICNKEYESVTIGQDISLGFEVPSLDDMLAFVKEKGVAIHSGPVAPNPHVKFFYVLDPNGLKIQFVENM
jgi:lactoylglutathione lyase